MKRFEIYAAKLPYGLETGTYVIILGNGVVNDAIFCAPIMSGENNNDKNRFHIQANTKNGRTGTIMVEHMNNLEVKRINGKIDVLAEDDYQHVKEKIAALYIPFNMERV